MCMINKKKKKGFDSQRCKTNERQFFFILYPFAVQLPFCALFVPVHELVFLYLPFRLHYQITKYFHFLKMNRQVMYWDI